MFLIKSEVLISICVDFGNSTQDVSKRGITPGITYTRTTIIAINKNNKIINGYVNDALTLLYKSFFVFRSSLILKKDVDIVHEDSPVSTIEISEEENIWGVFFIALLKESQLFININNSHNFSLKNGFFNFIFTDSNASQREIHESNITDKYS